MIKGLEAYKLFLDDVEHCIQSGGCHFINYKYKEIVEKSLKAFEIIKEKKVNIVRLFQKECLEDYNNNLNTEFGSKHLTEEEFNLLKEALL